MSGLSADGGAGASAPRVEVRWGYGQRVFGDRFIGTPALGLAMSGGSREYSVGWRLELPREAREAFDLGLELMRREAGGGDAPEHRVGVMLTTRW